MQRDKKKQQKEPSSNKENSSRGPAGFEAENCDKDKKKRGMYYLSAGGPHRSCKTVAVNHDPARQKTNERKADLRLPRRHY
ncbi:unnamed protein product [Sphagnum troendelagicum]|jgi:hypothetical protein